MKRGGEKREKCKRERKKGQRKKRKGQKLTKGVKKNRKWEVKG
jgi:hypothetical protein